MSWMCWKPLAGCVRVLNASTLTVNDIEYQNAIINYCIFVLSCRLRKMTKSLANKQNQQRNSINIVRNVCTQHTHYPYSRTCSVLKRQSRIKYRFGRILLVCMSKILKLVYLFWILFLHCHAVSLNRCSHILVSFAFTMTLLRMHACFIYSVTLDNDNDDEDNDDDIDDAADDGWWWSIKCDKSILNVNRNSITFVFALLKPFSSLCVSWRASTFSNSMKWLDESWITESTNNTHLANICISTMVQQQWKMMLTVPNRESPS